MQPLPPFHLQPPSLCPLASPPAAPPALPAEATGWSARYEGLRGSLAAKEAHAAALEAELSSRPTQAHVDELRQQVGTGLGGQTQVAAGAAAVPKQRCLHLMLPASWLRGCRRTRCHHSPGPHPASRQRLLG